MAVTRRAILSTLSAGTFAGLTATCRDTGKDLDHVIRAWFRANHLDEPSRADLTAIREYLARPALKPDPTIQPGLLFNPEVDFG